MLLEKEYFDIWMHRIMDLLERIERNQKPSKASEYPVVENGEKLYDNYDLCRMLHISKRTLQRYRTQYGLPYKMLNQKAFIERPMYCDLSRKILINSETSGKELFDCKKSRE